MDFKKQLRAFEIGLQKRMAEIDCPCHLCIGQEDVPAAIHEFIQPRDWLFAPHRSHGYYLAKGGDPQKLIDEILGLPTGINGGFSGSQSVSDPAINFHSTAIVGGLVGAAVGTAYALKMDKSEAIVVCATGDAGPEQGVYWEAVNWAVLNYLPIAFIVENNGMSVDAKIEERQAMPLIVRAGAFGLVPASTVGEAFKFAHMHHPSFYEKHVELECDHIAMSYMMPTKLAHE